MNIASRINLQPWNATQSYQALNQNLLVAGLRVLPKALNHGVKTAALEGANLGQADLEEASLNQDD